MVHPRRIESCGRGHRAPDGAYRYAWWRALQHRKRCQTRHQRRRSEVQLSIHSLAFEADTFQRPLLGNVVNLRAGLQTVRGSGAEEILDELPLRFCPNPMTAVFGE